MENSSWTQEVAVLARAAGTEAARAALGALRERYRAHDGEEDDVGREVEIVERGAGPLVEPDVLRRLGERVR